MKSRGYLIVALTTTLNIILYAATFGRFIFLEGRVRGGVFSNWLKRFRYRPRRFVLPTTEEEIVNLVKHSTGIRFFGAGHSFNDGVVADDTLVSLDNYRGVIWKDLVKKQVAFKGGTRVREAARLLLDEGLAFGALPSHDAQSIAGILATDVHGTGRDWGFVSELVVSIKLVDGKGDVHVCQPTDDLFKAAVGGIGAVGIITEVVVQAVDRFNVEQKVELSNLSFVEQNLDQLLQTNEHLSLYLFPFTTKCQINTWNSTAKRNSLLGDLREFVSISLDALLAAWFGGLMAGTGLLPKLSTIAHGLKRGTDLVLESNKAFNRTIYHLHQELEFTVAFEQTIATCRRFIKLYEEMYPSGLPYTIIEVRFTPAGHDRTLIGAGRARRSVWLDLLCNDAHGFERYYAAAEALMKETGARPHLGKFSQSFRQADLANLHQEHFAKFLRLIEEHDPAAKFANEFTRRLFRDL
ncbi:MAG: D-arabinono-1,4-lactone oxidase [Pyrinomonadaceae bacterium]